MATALRCDQASDLAGGFVLGALDAEETAAVREHLATCDQPHAEFAELGGVVPYLVDTVDPVEPPAVLHDRIRAAAAADLRARARDDLAADRLISVLGRSPAELVGSEPAMRPAVEPASSPEAEAAMPDGDAAGRAAPAGGPAVIRSIDEGPSVARRRVFGSMRPAYWVASIAAVLLIVVLGAGDLLLQQDLSSTHAYADRVSQALALAARPGSKTAILGPGTSGGGAGGLAVLPAGGPGILVAHDLAPTSGNQVYEAWLIVGQGAPAPAGSFTVGADGRGWLEGFAAVPSGAGGPVTVALTREPGPGATKPTLPIVSSGSIGNATS